MAWLRGGEALCNLPPKDAPHPVRLVLLGAPGVGKGTQAALLAEETDACHLSTGDVFRAALFGKIGPAAPAMARALECMRKGELVSDETVLDILRERVHCLRCRGGFLLDGFPRTTLQAEVLEQLLLREKRPLTAVINYEMPLEEIVERLSGRRVCSSCKAVYHLKNLPRAREGICDRCGAALYQREDDQVESVRVRMKTYLATTEPLVEFYRSRKLLIPISALGTAEEICRRTVKAVNDFRNGVNPPTSNSPVDHCSLPGKG